MSVGINFGSATSGAGFDVDTNVTSIMALQRTPETAWKSRVTALQAQDAALTTLGTHLSSLSSALSSLTSFDGVLSAKSGASSDSSTVALTAANSNAHAGAHSVFVSQLAQVSTQSSSTVAANDVLSGSVSIQIGSGSPVSFTVDSSSNTLATLASALNHANLGVTASVVSDASGVRLSLISNTSGAAGQIIVQAALHDQTTQQPIALSEGQPGLDASFLADGIRMTSASNTVQGAIPGVTLQLLNTSSSAAQIEIVNDTSSVSTALQSFVDAYNQVVSDVATQEGKDAGGNAEPLFGSTVLSTIQAQLSTSLATASPQSGAVTYLSQLGVTTGTDGKLSIDATTLASALNTKFADVQSFFQAAGNFGQSLTTTLSNLGGDNAYGVVKLALSQNSDEEQRMNDNVTALEARLADYQKSLTTQLNTANQILQAIPQRLEEVKQMYAAITGYGNNS